MAQTSRSSPAIGGAVPTQCLTGEFVIKVFNRPFFQAYANELDTGDEDVLVCILSGDGSSHWLVGRSFSDLLDTEDTPETGDDYWPASFVDPGTASVYHSRISRFGRMILYNGEWYEFDLMVSVSPTEEPTNEGSAQYFVADNDVSGAIVDGVATLSGDLTFTLLGNPDPNDVDNHRTESLMADASGRVYTARATFLAANPGTATLSFFNSNPAFGPTVRLVRVEANGDVVMLPNIGFGIPAARINVFDSAFEVNVKLQGPLEVRLYQRGPANTDADILNDQPVAKARPQGL